MITLCAAPFHAQPSIKHEYADDVLRHPPVILSVRFLREHDKRHEMTGPRDHSSPIAINCLSHGHAYAHTVGCA